uniref:Uncharacterized protein n=1 Tax=Rhizophora mucronata TaxID=61149 RepID=A0A2P2N0C2_RHIMU
MIQFGFTRPIRPDVQLTTNQYYYLSLLQANSRYANSRYPIVNHHCILGTCLFH